MTKKQARESRKYLLAQINTALDDCIHSPYTENVGDREVYLALGYVEAMRNLGCISNEQRDTFCRLLFSAQADAAGYGIDEDADDSRSAVLSYTVTLTE